MKKIFATVTVAVVVAFGAVPRAVGQELSFLWGAMRAPEIDKSSFTWQIDYRQNLYRNLAASIAYINEGHVEGHHRDGTAWEIWAQLPLAHDRIALSLGGGIYYFYEQQYLAGTASANIHGTAPILSIAATGYISDRWFYRLAINRIEPSKQMVVNTVALGGGFWFGQDKKPLARKPADAPTVEGYVTEHQLTFFAGQSVVNTFLSESAAAYALEYRHGIITHLDWSLAGIYEGDPKIVRRNGVALQLWAVNAFYNRRIAVGFGLGPYVFIDRKNPRSSVEKLPAAVSPLVSLTFSTRLSDHWHLRLIWDRVTTSYNRDSDIFRAGLGYHWGGSAPDPL